MCCVLGKTLSQCLLLSGKLDEMLGGGGGAGLTSHPGGSRNTPSHFMLRKLG